jgi:hypothetical protein
MFNRFKLGRSLDEVSTYGCDLLLKGSGHFRAILYAKT